MAETTPGPQNKRDKKYVLGFIIDPHGYVALIRKRRPPWQEGLLNGIGGHIEAGELPAEAMDRECQEEVGLTLKWNSIAHFTTVLWEMWVFATSINDVSLVEGKEDEEIEVYPADRLPTDVIPNLRFLIPFAIYNIYGDYMEIRNPHKPEE